MTSANRGMVHLNNSHLQGHCLAISTSYIHQSNEVGWPWEKACSQIHAKSMNNTTFKERGKLEVISLRLDDERDFFASTVQRNREIAMTTFVCYVVWAGDPLGF